jgi:hypothetical protein
MGKQRNVTGTIPRCGITRDGDLIGVNLNREDAETVVSDLQTCYPEQVFRIIPTPKSGKREKVSP